MYCTSAIEIYLPYFSYSVCGQGMMGLQGVLRPRFVFHMFSASQGFHICSFADCSCVYSYSYEIKMSLYWDCKNILKERVLWTLDDLSSSPGFAAHLLDSFGKHSLASFFSSVKWELWNRWPVSCWVQGHSGHTPLRLEETSAATWEFSWWDRLLGKNNPNFSKYTQNKCNIFLFRVRMMVRLHFYGIEGNGAVIPLSLILD